MVPDEARYVQPDHCIRVMRFEEPAGDHRFGAAHYLLRGLEHEQEPAVQVPDVIDQRARRAEHHRDVAVVAARVHVALGLRLEFDA